MCPAAATSCIVTRSHPPDEPSSHVAPAAHSHTRHRGSCPEEPVGRVLPWEWPLGVAGQLRGLRDGWWQRIELLLWEGIAPASSKKLCGSQKARPRCPECSWASDLHRGVAGQPWCGLIFYCYKIPPSGRTFAGTSDISLNVCCTRPCYTAVCINSTLAAGGILAIQKSACLCMPTSP